MKANKDFPQQGPMDSAIIPDFDDQPLFDELTLLDRSTLELWADCPWRAANTDQSKECSMMLVAGSLAHDCIANAMGAYIQAGGAMYASELRQQLDYLIKSVRPDVQEEVIAAVKPILYRWSSMVCGTHPENILACDGGDKYEKSGQFAKDYPEYNARATSEVDLLLATESPEVVACYDYKTGWKDYSWRDVSQSFQFQMHAVLIFDAFPSVNAIEYRVWNTRTNDLTYPCLFKRTAYEQYEKRLSAAVQSWFTNKDNPQPWPLYEKCQQCSCVLKCPAAHSELTEINTDPVAFVNRLASMHAAIERMEKLAAAHVDQHGTIKGNGIAYGRDKPKAERKAAATLYETA